MRTRLLSASLLLATLTACDRNNEPPVTPATITAVAADAAPAPFASYELGVAPNTYLTGARPFVLVSPARGTPDLGQCVSIKDGLMQKMCAKPIPGPETFFVQALNEKDFQTLSVEGSVNGSGGVAAMNGSGGVEFTTTKYSLYNRYFVARNRKLQLTDNEPEQSYVSSVQEGIELRAIWNVSIKNSKAEAEFSAVWAEMEAALATGRASVSVQYSALGAIPVDLPTVPDNIQTIKQLYEASERFDKAIDVLRVALKRTEDVTTFSARVHSMSPVILGYEIYPKQEESKVVDNMKLQILRATQRSQGNQQQAQQQVSH